MSREIRLTLSMMSAFAGQGARRLLQKRSRCDRKKMVSESLRKIPNRPVVDLVSHVDEKRFEVPVLDDMFL